MNRPKRDTHGKPQRDRGRVPQRKGARQDERKSKKGYGTTKGNLLRECFIEFPSDWIFTRSLWPFLLSLPCIIASLIAVAAIYTNGRPEERIRTLARYEADFRDRVARSETDAAMRAGRKVLSLKPSPETALSLAGIIDSMGEHDVAAERIRSLAPDPPEEQVSPFDLNERSVTSFGPAHALRAKKLLAAHQGNRDEFFRIRRHLLAADAFPKNEEGYRTTLGETYLQLAQEHPKEKSFSLMLDAAARNLLMFGTPDAETSFRLASLYKSSGDRAASREARDHSFAQARKHALNALDAFRATLEANPSDQAARDRYAQTCIYAARHEDAVTVFEDGMKLSEDYRRENAVFRVCLAWFDYVHDDFHPERDLEVKRRVLETARGYASSGDPQIVDRAAALAVGSGQDEFVGMESQAMTVTAHGLLGTKAASLGNYEEAAGHLEKALTMGGSPTAANNLAWVLMQLEPPNYDRALELSSKSVAEFPANASFRETHGQALFGLKQWRKAIAELEAALQLGKDTPAVRRSLRDAYKAIDETALSELHGEVLAEFEKIEARATQTSTPE